MKKLFAVLFVVLFASSFAFSADTYVLGPATGTFTANVVCTPTLTPPASNVFLGNFFENHVMAPATGTLQWALTGPNIGTYDITVGVSTADDAILYGSWTIDATTGLADATYPGLSFSGIDCSTAIIIQYDVTSVTTVTPGTKTWTLSVGATVNI